MELGHAQEFAARGWAVLPLVPSDKVPLHTLVRHGSHDATADLEVIAGWWSEVPDANVGIATGVRSGIWVFDIDGPEGADSLADLECEYEPLPVTFCVRTARGRHYYFRQPEGRTVRNRAGVRPGVDVRGNGGYVVAPGSVHPSGVVYEAEDAGVPVADAPAWLLDLVAPPVVAPAAEAMRLARQPVPGAALDGLAETALRTAVERLRAARRPTGSGGGTRNDTLNREAHGLAACGVPRAVAEAALLPVAQEVGLGDAEARRTFESGYTAGLASPRVRRTPQRSKPQSRPAPQAPVSSPSPVGPAPEAPISPSSVGPGAEGALSPSSPDAARASDPPKNFDARSRGRGGQGGGGVGGEDEADDEWRDGLLRTKGGDIKSTPWNAQEIIRRDPDVRGIIVWDEHRQDIMIQARPPWLPAVIRRTYPRPLDDVDIAWCGHWLQRVYGAAWTVEAVATALTAAAHLWTVHPLREWLSSLQWDGVERAEHWLTDYLGVKRSDLTAAYGSRWLIAAVARAFDPGCKAENVLVLEGDQGLGKSRALRILATGDVSPKSAGPHSAWFTDAKIDVESKEGVMLLGGVWIAEFGELGNITKAEVEAVKAFVSRQVDKLRYPWARRAVERPRGCVFAGTTNPRNYHRDATGGRRWWPVECTEVNVAGLQAAREQLWAEAVARYRRGDPWHLRDVEDAHLIEASAAEVAERQEVDPWVSIAASWFDGHPEATTRELLDQVDLDRSKRTARDEMRAAAVLTQLGFVSRRRRRVNGVREYVYTRDMVLFDGE